MTDPLSGTPVPRLGKGWTKLTGTPVVVTMWMPQVYRRGTWWPANA